MSFRRHAAVVALLLPLAVAGCSRTSDQALRDEVAEARAELDERNALDFTAGSVPACGLLSAAEVEAVLGPLVVPPFSADDDGRPARGGESCAFRARDGRQLVVGGVLGRGEEALDAMTDTQPVPVGGSADAVRLQGCCMLLALSNHSLVKLDWSRTTLSLETAAALLSRTLDRVRDPLPVDGDAGVAAANALPPLPDAAAIRPPSSP